MVAAKKQKLNGGGSGSSTPTAMSAFAARQQLWGVAATKAVSEEVVPEKATPEPAPPAPERVTRSRTRETASARSVAARSSKRKSPDQPVPDLSSVKSKKTKGIEGGQGEQRENGDSKPASPHPEPSGKLIRQHSSFKPNKNNLQRKAGGRLVLSTREAERLVILGSYGIRVREGEATLAGAILTPADGVHWVHAAHCHAVPVLRTADDTVLELEPHPAAKGLRELAKLNPVFAKLWNEGPREATFQIKYTSDDVPKRAVLQELVSPAEWNKKLSALAAAKRKTTPVIFLCGPKSSGKSTFGRLLANRLMTDRGGVRNNPWSDVMVLDLDPGQPEYAPPGVVSLSKITAPNLSPSFCHPNPSPTQSILRAHAIAAVTPALDPAHFIECVLDLFTHYQRSPYVKCPLVINTPGWVQGTGLDILTELITPIHPTEVIYMSQDGPEETVAGLQSSCTTPTPSIPFSTLPSQPSEGSSSRTPLHLRTMQTMSYFHQRHPSPPQQPTWWDPTPLPSLRPWRVRYAGGKDRGFLGILCYDHQPAPELLAEAVNGTVLALVKLESRAALRGLFPLNPDPETIPTTSTTASGSRSTSTTTSSDSSTSSSTPLPLIPNPQGLTLSPSHSHLLGLVLVRGIDMARNELQLLTPLGADVITTAVAGTAGEELVLVAGRFDVPSWAYTEGLYSSSSSSAAAVSSFAAGVGGEVGGRGEEEMDVDGESESGSEAGLASDGEEGDEEAEEEEEVIQEEGNGRIKGTVHQEVPWVEMLHGSQKRAVGSKVWRVRRDLGRNN